MDIPPKKEEKLFYPEKFEAKQYKAWSRSLVNYLDSIIGKSGVPLTYVIRAEDVTPDDAVDEYQRTLWSTPHAGFAFREDNRQVYRVLKDLIIATDGWAWFNMAPEGNGRAAFLRLEAHYLGTEHTARRASEAEARLRQLHYKSEAIFKFEDYVSGLYECFEMLEDNNQGLHEAQKVNKLLAGVQSNNAEITGLKPLIRKEFPNDFDGAATQMAAQIANIYPATLGQDNRPKRRIAGVEAEAVARAGRGRHGGSIGGRNMINGVDVTNPNRNFTDDEWRKLREGGMMAWIISRRNTGRGTGGGGRGGRAGRGGGGRGYRGGRGGRAGQEHGGRRVQIAGVTVMGEDAQHDATTTAGRGAGQQNTAAGRGAQHGAAFGGRRHSRG